MDDVVAQVIAPDYRDAIDAITQEQTWFDGGAEGDADIETVAYVESRSPACRDLHDT